MSPAALPPAPPEDWNGRRPDVPVLQERRSEAEVAWVAWGEENEVVRALEAAGADVREASALSLEEAVLALMRSGRGGESGTVAERTIDESRQRQGTRR